MKLNFIVLFAVMAIAGLLIFSGAEPKKIESDFVGKIQQRNALIESIR